MAGRHPITTPETWIKAARDSLVAAGPDGVKIDRIASKLNVSRGGFYHFFENKEELFSKVIEYWTDKCRFFPDDSLPSNGEAAGRWLKRVVRHHVEHNGYDHRFDLAVRDWARSYKRAAWAIERADLHRVDILERFFDVLGYDPESSRIRARIFYYHQIGYHALDVNQSPEMRRGSLNTYLDILCGPIELAMIGIAGEKQDARCNLYQRS